jgi:putative endopeptidase
LFAFGASTDQKDSKNNALYGDQSGLGLPDRDYYFDDSKVAQMAGLKIYIAKLLTYSGFEQSEAEASANSVFEFEKKMAEFFLTKVEQRDPIKTYNKRSIAELKAAAPFDWDFYFKTLEINPKEVVLTSVSYFEKLYKLVHSEELAVIKTYLTYRCISGAAPYLSSKFEKAHFDYYETIINGTKDQKPRWKRTLEHTSRELR